VKITWESDSVASVKGGSDRRFLIGNEPNLRKPFSLCESTRVRSRFPSTYHTNAVRDRILTVGESISHETTRYFLSAKIVELYSTKNKFLAKSKREVIYLSAAHNNISRVDF